MRIPHSLAAPVLAGLVACTAAPPPPPPPPAGPDPRIAAAEEVLRPVWHKGMTWTLEVQGKALSDLSDHWVPFWTRVRYTVLSADDTSATVDASQEPFLRGPGFRVPPPRVREVSRSPRLSSRRGSAPYQWTDLDTYPNGHSQGRCSADLRFWLPWRLVGGELFEFGQTSDARRAARTDVLDDSPPRTGTSPCIPLVPRHPMLQPTSVVVPKGPQSIEVTDEAVSFTIYEAAHTRITWLKGHPWWALMERVGSSRTDYATLDERRPDRMQVHRARLIAIDGGAIEPLAWSDDTWLSDNWPGGGLDESELPTFDEIVPYERWSW